MFYLTKKIEVALMVLRHLLQVSDHQLKKNQEQGTSTATAVDAPSKPVTTAKELAALYQIPEMHTSKIMQLLARSGFLISKQGAGGGYLLPEKFVSKVLQTVSLYDLLETLEGNIGAVKCLQEEKNSCSYQEKCNILPPMQHLNLKFMSFYKSISLGELLLEGHPPLKNKELAQQTQPLKTHSK